MAGQPPIEFDEKDFDVIETFGRIKASYQLMADHFKCSKMTIHRRMDDENSEYCYRYKKGLNETVSALANKQIDVAMGGNVTMLIWLGKQLLEQTDKSQYEHTGKDGGPIVMTALEAIKYANDKDKKAESE